MEGGGGGAEGMLGLDVAVVVLAGSSSLPPLPGQVSGLRMPPGEGEAGSVREGGRDAVGGGMACRGQLFPAEVQPRCWQRRLCFMLSPARFTLFLFSGCTPQHAGS